MNIRLAAAEIHIPRQLREKWLRRLFTLTARAFGCDAAFVSGLPFAGMTEEFARFTSEKSTACLQDEEAALEIACRLRELAYAFGQEFRSVLRLRSRTEVMRAGRLLYRVLGIDFRGSSGGGITVTKCSFARYYSLEACEFISVLDEGILAGLAGGGSLSFKGRITGNMPSCTAFFRFPEELP